MPGRMQLLTDYSCMLLATAHEELAGWIEWPTHHSVDASR